ncbi:MAG: GNAT family N-acetyltransferase [candidate division KSB1 bacterium]|nr:GNAT family N-acetyltransferase [candidate division KSB1 bacterium]MDZ7302131.1 GNAT family N-acetyltransferase [candidate division KSB1 bacterium]MDZ7311241.1 GNAT family N-acetyltransferase [candidate division KSB1 bacterium]
MATREDKNLPSGKIKTLITYLEMREPPPRELKPPRLDILIMQAVCPTASFYRYLYNTIGGPWLWYERRQLSDEKLCEIIQNPKVEIYVLYVNGVPAGYAEIDRRQEPDIELAYFGIMPEFLGQQLGPFLLKWIIDKVWSYQPARFWLHTCDLDHPKALALYRQAGFVPYKQEEKIIDDPRLLGLI